MKVKISYQLFISAALCMALCGGAQEAVAAATTTTTLAVTSGGTPVTTVTPGSVVTLTATVTAGSTPVAPGRVNFCDATAAHCTDIHLLGTEQLTSAGTAVLKFVPGIGSHSYKAVFVGTNSDAASSSSASSLTVTGKYATATTFAQAGVPGNYTLTAKVAGSVYEVGLASPTGTVSFLDTSNGDAVLGVATLGTGESALNWTDRQTLVPVADALYVATGDFNGDGKADLAITGYSSYTVTILLGNGDGTFMGAGSFATGGHNWSIAVGDFNGDGIPDLAVPNSFLDTVTILLGNGDGTFTAAPSPATGAYPAAVAVGDFNGDGKADLAVANEDANTVTILLGNGDGTFTAAPVSPATGSVPVSIVVADFNGDGKADLAVANENNAAPGSVTILLGNGDGTFKAAASPALPGSPNSIVVGDFNGDGKADLAVVNFGDHLVTILLGNGDGTFTAAASPATGSQPEAIAVGDFNGDGKVDLAVADAATNGVTVLLGNGDGTFTAAASPAAISNCDSLVVGDFNGDGGADLAVLNGNSPNSLATVLLSEVTETAIATASGISPGGSGPQLVEASYSGDSSYSPSVSGTIVLFNQPPPTTTSLAVTSEGTEVTTVTWGSEVTLTATVMADSMPVTPGQVNFCDATAAHCTDIHLLGTAQLTKAGTAALKLVPARGSHSYKAVFLGTTSDLASSSGASSLTVTGKYPTTTMIAKSGSAGNYTLTATVASAGGTVAPTGTVSFLDTNNGNAVLGTAALGTGATGLSWLNSQTPATGRTPISVAVGDFNGDGKADLVVTDVNDNTVTILLGNGNGTFAAVPGTVAGDDTNFVAVGDFNGDGIPDLAAATTDRGVTVLLGNGDGTFTAAASPAAGNDPISIAVADFNGDGKADLAVANYNDNTVTILLGNGDGTFVAAASPTTGVKPYSVAVGDFNGDGKADLAVANTVSNTLTILLGNGDGTFTAAASPPTGSGPGFVAVGDFNGDGKADLAVANYSSDTVTILLGNGDGTFTAAASPATGGAPVSVAVGDFNADGISDLAVANFTDNTVTVLLAEELTATATATGIAPAGPGTHLVDASYPGDSNYGPSASGTVSLSGTGTGPAVSLSASSLSFGNQPPSTTSGSQPVTLNNTGNAALTISGITSSGDFAQTNNCGSSVAAGSSCTITVTFTPAARGPRKSAVVITDNAAGSPQRVIVTGVGAAAALSPASVTFSSQAVGTGSAAQTVTLTNKSTSTMNIWQIAITGTNASDFLKSTACATRLGASSNCTISVTFTPSAAGTRTAVLLVSNDGGGSPQAIRLTGSGVAGSSAPSGSLSTTEVFFAEQQIGTESGSLSIPAVSFGEQEIGTTAPARTVLLTNNGTGELKIESITVSGPSSDDFTETNDCGAGLAPGGSCTFRISFAPRQPGERTAVMLIKDSGGAKAHEIRATGVGAEP